MVMGGLLLLLVGVGLIVGGLGVMTKYKEGLRGIITGCMMFILGMPLVVYGLAVIIFVN
jgi:hypothetical protein